MQRQMEMRLSELRPIILAPTLKKITKSTKGKEPAILIDQIRHEGMKVYYAVPEDEKGDFVVSKYRATIFAPPELSDDIDSVVDDILSTNIGSATIVTKIDIKEETVDNPKQILVEALKKAGIDVDKPELISLKEEIEKLDKTGKLKSMVKKAKITMEHQTVRLEKIAEARHRYKVYHPVKPEMKFTKTAEAVIIEPPSYKEAPALYLALCRISHCVLSYRHGKNPPSAIALPLNVKVEDFDNVNEPVMLGPFDKIIVALSDDSWKCLLMNTKNMIPIRKMRTALARRYAEAPCSGVVELAIESARNARGTKEFVSALLKAAIADVLAANIQDPIEQSTIKKTLALIAEAADYYNLKDILEIIHTIAEKLSNVEKETKEKSIQPA